MPAGDPAACGSSPGLCSQQLVVVGGALVVVLSVSDDRGQAFAHQSFCDVSGEGREREREGENAFHISGVSNERERSKPSLGQRAQLDREISDFNWNVFGERDSC